PPASATIMYGRLDAVGFLSTESLPLIMEGHQSLPVHFDVNCCSGIEVNVRNGDGLTGTVTMELLLSDSTGPRLRPISLGLAPVAVRESLEQRSREETLHFSMPDSPSIQSFDEMIFRFYTPRERRT